MLHDSAGIELRIFLRDATDEAPESTAPDKVICHDVIRNVVRFVVQLHDKSSSEISKIMVLLGYFVVRWRREFRQK